MPSKRVAMQDIASACGLSALFLDSPAPALNDLMSCDFMSTENIVGVISVPEGMIQSGAKTIGFVGDRNHCGSFYERRAGFTVALSQAKLPVDESVCILAPDSPVYGGPDWLLRRIRHPDLPYAWARIKSTPVFRGTTR